MEGAALHSPDLLDVAYLTIEKKQVSNARKAIEGI